MKRQNRGGQQRAHPPPSGAAPGARVQNPQLLHHRQEQARVLEGDGKRRFGRAKGTSQLDNRGGDKQRQEHNEERPFRFCRRAGARRRPFPGIGHVRSVSSKPA
ncbi:MAG: hypothetical protein NTW86_21305 [Candidatus Sumerlaeota bacterium]|nr:hypothetical protein [Candidatus Sumerlaeota bacterium]